jgi:hypothetical protein
MEAEGGKDHPPVNDLPYPNSKNEAAVKAARAKAAKAAAARRAARAADESEMMDLDADPDAAPSLGGDDEDMDAQPTVDADNSDGNLAEPVDNEEGDPDEFEEDDCGDMPEDMGLLAASDEDEDEDREAEDNAREGEMATAALRLKGNRLTISAAHGLNLAKGRIDLLLVAAQDPFYYVLHNTRPVGRLVKAKAHADLWDIFERPQFAAAFKVAVQSGLKAADAHRFGFRVHTHSVRLPAVQAALVRKQTAQIRDRFQTKLEAAHREFDHAMKIALAGTLKGCLDHKDRDLRAGLTATLKRAGVVNAEETVHRALSRFGEAFLATVSQNARNLVGKPASARNEIARIVERAAFSSESSDAGSQLAADLSEAVFPTLAVDNTSPMTSAIVTAAVSGTEDQVAMFRGALQRLRR